MGSPSGPQGAGEGGQVNEERRSASSPDGEGSWAPARRQRGPLSRPLCWVCWLRECRALLLRWPKASPAAAPLVAGRPPGVAGEGQCHLSGDPGPRCPSGRPCQEPSSSRLLPTAPPAWSLQLSSISPSDTPRPPSVRTPQPLGGSSWQQPPLGHPQHLPKALSELDLCKGQQTRPAGWAGW